MSWKHVMKKKMRVTLIPLRYNNKLLEITLILVFGNIKRIHLIMSTIHMKYKRLRFCRVSTSSQNYSSFSSVHFLCTSLENFTWKMQEFLLICYVNSFPFQAEKTKPPENDKTGVIPFLIKNITLPYAYTNYTISVRLRSPFANKTEEFWSEPGILSIMTDSKSMQNACTYEHTVLWSILYSNFYYSN